MAWAADVLPQLGAGASGAADRPGDRVPAADGRAAVGDRQGPATEKGDD